MTEHLPVAIILSLAVVAQAAAAVMAMRLTAVAGRRLAWLLIAGALLLMTVRRLVPLVRLVSGSDIPLDPLNESVGLLLSLLMAAGVARMRPIFAERQESETLYRSLVSSMAEGVVLQSADGAVTAVNPAAERIEGRSAEEMLGRTPDDAQWGAVTEDGRPLEGKLHPAMVTLRTGAPQSDVVMGIHRPDQTLVWISVNAQPLMAPGSPLPYAVVSTFHDITARKAAEEALHRREEEVRALVENSPDFISRHDREGRMIYCNPSVSRLFCFSDREIFGKTALEILPGTQTGQVFHDAVMGVLKTGHPAEIEFALEGVKTERSPVHHARFVAELDRAGEVTSVLAVGRDITERKLAEAELLRYREHLEELVSERTADLEAANRELEAFSYSVSHDLRTPLRAIDGFSQLLAARQAVATDEAAQRLVRVVRESSAKMSRLIDGMLAFFRTGRIEMRLVEVDMAQLVREVWRALETTRAGGMPRLDLGPIVPVRGDPAMLRQLWANLLSNAVKFTGPVADAKVEVGGSRSGEECTYYVKDNGVGFDPAYAHKLFGVFQRLHGVEEFEGTGIGLAIVKRIVTRHGGRVDAEGEVGKGVTVRFSLPTRGGHREPC